MDVGIVDTPQQRDNWSCGLRVVLAVRSLLQRGIGLINGQEWLQPMEDVEVPDEDITEETMRALIADWPRLTQCPPDTPAPCEQPFGAGRKRPVATPARAWPTASVKKEPGVKTDPLGSDSKDAPSSSAGDKKPEGSESSSAGSKKPEGSESKDAQSSSAGDKKPESSDSADAKQEEETLEEALGRSVADLLKERQVSKQLKVDNNLAKAVLKNTDFSFNDVFQKRHFTKPSKGHWQHFLSSVLAIFHKRNEGPLQCEVCRQILLDFDIPKAASQMQQKLLKKQSPTQTPTQSTPSTASSPEASQPSSSSSPEGREMVPYVPQEDEPPAKKRRGRPRTGETVTFDIRDFMKDQRSGQYHFLSEEEACIFSAIFAATA